MTGIGEEIVERAALYWELKITGLAILAVIAIHRLHTLLHAAGPLASIASTPPRLSTVKAPFYTAIAFNDWTALARLAMLIASHALIAVILAAHIPVFTAVILAIATLGSKPYWLADAINYVDRAYSTPMAGAGVVAALLLALLLATTTPRTRNSTVILPLLTMLCLLTGSAFIATRAESILVSHVAVGYATLVYMLASRKGLHWLLVTLRLLPSRITK